MKRRLVYAMLGVLVALIAIATWNYLSVTRPVASRLSQDERNKVVSLWSYHQYGVVSSTLVLDLRSSSNEAALLDIMRAVLQSAEALKDRQFNLIVLSYKGRPKFQLEGEYFQTLGREFGSQNPIYTLRTFPEHVYRMDGQPAYGRWTGGLLGVLSRQMEDLNRFGRDWYLEEELRSREGAAH